jgi:hypothetical protein
MLLLDAPGTSDATQKRTCVAEPDHTPAKNAVLFVAGGGLYVSQLYIIGDSIVGMNDFHWEDEHSPIDPSPSVQAEPLLDIVPETAGARPSLAPTTMPKDGPLLPL